MYEIYSIFFKPWPQSNPCVSNFAHIPSIRGFPQICVLIIAYNRPRASSQRFSSSLVCGTARKEKPAQSVTRIAPVEGLAAYGLSPS